MSRQLPKRPLVQAVQVELRGLSAEIDRLDALAAEAYGLNRTDMRCLDVLGRSGAQTPTELAHALGFTTGGITTVIDRLEQAGYARRRADPSDRRRLIVEPTELLAQRDAQIFGRLIQTTETLVGGYSDAELKTIHDFLARSRATIATHAESVVQQARAGRAPPARAHRAPADT
jgi:DNA-binding MarR family transcriptional regulator